MVMPAIKKSISLMKEKGISSAINSLSLESSYQLGMPHVYGQPIVVQLEPTTHCNAKCIMCARTHNNKLKKEQKHMSFETFRKIMLKFPYCETINIQGLGEPLLNPDLMKMIKFCKEKKIWVHFITNASKLSKSMSKKLILSGLDGMELSIDSANAKRFERVRKGLRFSAVIKNIKRLRELKNELKSNHPIADIRAIASKDNIGEIPEILRLAKSLGVRRVVLRILMEKPSLHIGLENVPEKQVSLLEKYKTYGQGIGVEVKLALPHLPPFLGRKKVRCRRLWKSVYITVDGWVTPCCFFPYKDYSFGNILQQDFQQIWNNKLYKDFRKKLNNAPNYRCRSCVWSE